MTTVLIAAIVGLLTGAGYDLRKYGKSEKVNGKRPFDWRLATYRWAGGMLTGAAVALGALQL